MRILTVVGNRPQFVKAAAVSHRLRERGEELLVHTGQHYDRELSEVFFEELELPPPDRTLETGSGSHAAQTAAIMRALEPVAEEVEPDAVLVYGDTNSTLAAALVAAKLGLPLAHVEAGMRSFDRGMPEEVNRIVADRLSDLLLCSTDVAVANLSAEGRDEGVLLVGDVMADIALLFGPIADRRSEVLDRFGVEPGAYVAATAHRPANVDDPVALGRLVEVLTAPEDPVIFCVHPRTSSRLADAGLAGRLRQGGVTVSEPLGYLDFTKLVRNAAAVMTDSGGLQKEAYLAGVPCVTLRDTTEWVETVELGWNRLVGLDRAAAADALAQLAAKRREGPPDAGIYGGGEAGGRVASAVAEFAASRPRLARR
jgi:UDP-GlcNAc3NAcA epimerase